MASFLKHNTIVSLLYITIIASNFKSKTTYIYAIKHQQSRSHRKFGKS